MDTDRYPFLNRHKIKVGTPEDVLALVRRKWPAAYQEGSTGYERTWFSDTPFGLRLVAHSWSPRRDMAWFWVRVSDRVEDTLDWREL